MGNITLNVQGMSCGKCVKSVEDSVGAVNGVNEVAVDLQAAKVTVTFDETVTSITVSTPNLRFGYKFSRKI